MQLRQARIKRSIVPCLLFLTLMYLAVTQLSGLMQGRIFTSLPGLVVELHAAVNKSNHFYFRVKPENYIPTAEVVAAAPIQAPGEKYWATHNPETSVTIRHEKSGNGTVVELYTAYPLWIAPTHKITETDDNANEEFGSNEIISEYSTKTLTDVHSEFQRELLTHVKEEIHTAVQEVKSQQPASDQELHAHTHDQPDHHQELGREDFRDNTGSEVASNPPANFHENSVNPAIPEIQDDLLKSTTFVSTLSAGEEQKFGFELYGMTLEATEIAAPEATKNIKKRLALSSNESDPTTASGDNKNNDYTPNVYKKNLPGFLAYHVAEPIVVVIDPGHGGVDPGTTGSNGLLEKELTLDIARRVKILAELHSDLKIVLTRDNDDGLSRAERIANVEKANGDLLISLHFNHLPQGEITLVETYYINEMQRNESLADKPHLAKVGLNSGLHGTAKPDFRQLAEISKNLARKLQSNVFSTVQAHNPLAIDAGVKEGSLYLLAGSNIPGALIELTCLSNPEEEDRLNSEGYRNELAKSLLNALRQFADSQIFAESV